MSVGEYGDNWKLVWSVNGNLWAGN